MFGMLARTADSPPTTAVSVFGCIAQKFKYRRSAEKSPDCYNTDLTLTVNEIVQMFRQGGVTIAGLPETPFDVCAEAPPENKINYINFEDIQGGTQESEINLQGTKVKILTVFGFAHARLIMDSIRKGGGCDADLVHIKNCPWTDSQQPCKNSGPTIQTL